MFVSKFGRLYHRNGYESPAIFTNPSGENKAAFSFYRFMFSYHAFSVAPRHPLYHHTCPGRRSRQIQVMAEYLDNDENGKPDNAAAVEALASRDASIIMAISERELNRIDPDRWHGAGFTANVALWATETNPKNGRFDATLEEILHLITAHGYANAYPRVFGERPGTQLGDCLDAARGGRFLGVPKKYPKGAWFTYDDRTCEYRCMATEYIYWALTSILGAQKSPERRREIEHEWRLWNVKDFKSTT